MFRLLIVDDEPIIVEGLFELFQDRDGMELDVYKAYTGMEALEIMEKKKMDIVLTDINMPGLSGLELTEKIYKSWKDCKVILLSGHSEFDYVYKAIKYEGVSYLLKTEGYDKILAQVEKCIVDLNNSFKDNEILEKAKQQMKQFMPLMQKEYIMMLLMGENVEISNKQFEELEICLKPNLPIWVVVGSIDNQISNITSKEKNSDYFTINAVGQKYFSENMLIQQTFCESQFLVWLIQAREFSFAGDQKDFLKLSFTMKNLLEKVQKVTKELLNKSVSFVYSAMPVEWMKLEEKYALLKLLLNYRNQMGNELVLIDDIKDGEIDSNITINQLSENIRLQLKKFTSLTDYLKNGQKSEYFELFDNILEVLREKSQANHNLLVEVYISISLFFLSYLNQNHLTEQAASQISITKLLHADEFNYWEEMTDYMVQLSHLIFELQKDHHDKSAIDVISRIKLYIQGHVSEELSLEKLASYVYFNPKYLSRLFKQSTGENLTDFIKNVKIQRSKELLMNKDYKIHEVAAAVGFYSAPYYTKFFRKETNMTPQEYRDSYFR